MKNIIMIPATICVDSLLLTRSVRRSVRSSDSLHSARKLSHRGNVTLLTGKNFLIFLPPDLPPDLQPTFYQSVGQPVECYVVQLLPPSLPPSLLIRLFNQSADGMAQ